MNFYKKCLLKIFLLSSLGTSLVEARPFPSYTKIFLKNIPLDLNNPTNFHARKIQLDFSIESEEPEKPIRHSGTFSFRKSLDLLKEKPLLEEVLRQSQSLFFPSKYFDSEKEAQEIFENLCQYKSDDPEFNSVLARDLPELQKEVEEFDPRLNSIFEKYFLDFIKGEMDFDPKTDFFIKTYLEGLKKNKKEFGQEFNSKLNEYLEYIKLNRAEILNNIQDKSQWYGWRETFKDYLKGFAGEWALESLPRPTVSEEYNSALRSLQRALKCNDLKKTVIKLKQLPKNVSVKMMELHKLNEIANFFIQNSVIEKKYEEENLKNLLQGIENLLLEHDFAEEKFLDKDALLNFYQYNCDHVHKKFLFLCAIETMGRLEVPTFSPPEELEEMTAIQLRGMRIAHKDSPEKATLEEQVSPYKHAHDFSLSALDQFSFDKGFYPENSLGGLRKFIIRSFFAFQIKGVESDLISEYLINQKYTDLQSIVDQCKYLNIKGYPQKDKYPGPGNPQNLNYVPETDLEEEEIVGKIKDFDPDTVTLLKQRDEKTFKEYAKNEADEFFKFVLNSRKVPMRDSPPSVEEAFTLTTKDKEAILAGAALKIDKSIGKIQNFINDSIKKKSFSEEKVNTLVAEITSLGDQIYKSISLSRPGEASGSQKSHAASSWNADEFKEEIKKGIEKEISSVLTKMKTHKIQRDEK